MKISEMREGDSALFQHAKSSWSSTFEIRIIRYSRNAKAVEYANGLCTQWALVSEMDAKFTFVDYIK